MKSHTCSRAFASILTCLKQFDWNLPRVTRKVRNGSGALKDSLLPPPPKHPKPFTSCWQSWPRQSKNKNSAKSNIPFAFSFCSRLVIAHLKSVSNSTKANDVSDCSLRDADVAEVLSTFNKV